MLFFYIPDLYDLCDVNIAFIDYMYAHPEKFRDCRIGAVYGTFPGMIWDGGRLISSSRLPDQKWMDIVLSFNRREIPVRFACTNSAIEEQHLSDDYCNRILSFADNGMNEVIVNSDVIEQYIRDSFSSYKIISSTTKCLDTLSLLEQELSKNYFLVVPDFALNNTDELLTVSKPEKCELLLNDSCGQRCPNRKADYYHVSRQNLGVEDNSPVECPFKHFKSMSVYELIKYNPASVSVEDVYGKYGLAGFKHFKIVGRRTSPLSCVESYVYYMVKEEYRWEVLSHFIKLLG